MYVLCCSLQFFYSIDATAEPETGPKLGRLVNHGEGKETNVKLATLDVSGQPTLCLFALRNIEKGEELLYNYGISDLPWKKNPNLKVQYTELIPLLCQCCICFVV